MVEFERMKYKDRIKKLNQRLESDLKYLSVLVNEPKLIKMRTEGS